MNIIINVDHFLIIQISVCFHPISRLFIMSKDYIVNSTMCIPNVYVAAYTTSIVVKYYALTNNALNITTSFNIIIVLVLIFEKHCTCKLINN